MSPVANEREREQLVVSGVLGKRRRRKKKPMLAVRFGCVHCDVREERGSFWAPVLATVEEEVGGDKTKKKCV